MAQTPAQSAPNSGAGNEASPPGDITRLLAEARGGNAEALNRVVTLVYDELHRLAHRQLLRERPDHTLNSGALVHEAYLKLQALNRIEWRDRVHFFSVAAGVMRRVLINYAVERKAQKRGGGHVVARLDEAHGPAIEPDADELTALDDALRRLERLEPRQGRVVECRLFGGMSVDDTAAALGVSTATVKRDWAMARAWLNRELAE